MDVNLDRYAGLPDDAATWAGRRALLLDQLAWLLNEAEALGPLLADLPAWALEGAPLPGERSVKETLADLAALDRTVHRPRLERLAAEEAPTFETPGGPASEGANDQPLDVLLEDLRAARTALLNAFRAVPEADWHRSAMLDGTPVTLFDLALRIARNDADQLRDLAYRLHGSQLSERS